MKASAMPQYKESAYTLDSVVVDRHDDQPNDNFFQVSRYVRKFDSQVLIKTNFIGNKAVRKLFRYR